MNLRSGSSEEEFKQLLSNCNDDAGHHLLWVDNNGDVNITQLPKDLSPAGFETAHAANIRFRLESFQKGNKYVGPSAAEDDKWVKKLFSKINELWQEGFQGYNEFL